MTTSKVLRFSWHFFLLQFLLISSVVTATENYKDLALSPHELLWLKQHPIIKIGVDPAYAPYSFIDQQGQFKGIAADFANLISKKLAVKFQLVPNLTWPQIIDAAKKRKIDVISTAAKTVEREAYLNFSQIYIPTPLVIMTRSDNLSISSSADLPSHKIALVKKYSSSKQVISEYPDLDVLSVDTPLDGLIAVSSGVADAYIGVLGIIPI